MNDARHRVTAPQCTLWPAHNFDTLDVVRRNLAEIKFASLGQVVDFDAVNQHEYLVGFCSPNPDLADCAVRALLAHGKSRNLPEKILNGCSITVEYILSRDHTDRAASIVDANRCSGNRDYFYCL